MATNDIRMQNDFANLLRKKTPDLSDDEVRKCFDEIVKSIENYLKQYAFQSNINKPSQARKELSDLSLSIKTVINKIRILDGTSQAHLIRLGFKTLATQSTLSGLYELVKVAEKIANAKPNKVSISGRIGLLEPLLSYLLLLGGKPSAIFIKSDCLSFKVRNTSNHSFKSVFC